MIKRYELLEIFENDDELKELINTESRTFRELWDSATGAKIRLTLENKYNLDMSSNVIRGKIKDAIKLYLEENRE
ncbi:MAG: hypothetical protein MR639_14235 [Clostridium sp.]|uniref:hypothetical protein n=1 Tax=Clostridium sp. TaxID=1506 RepID=UPI002A865BAD|nr:hypothetical protein [Clostridium sp.]MDY5098802.1 hypothetical protein [Clostridium sp.]